MEVLFEKSLVLGRADITSQYKGTSSMQCLIKWKTDTFPMGSQGWRDRGGLANRNSRRKT